VYAFGRGGSDGSAKTKNGGRGGVQKKKRIVHTHDAATFVSAPAREVLQSLVLLGEVKSLTGCSGTG